MGGKCEYSFFGFLRNSSSRMCGPMGESPSCFISVFLSLLLRVVGTEALNPSLFFLSSVGAGD